MYEKLLMMFDVPKSANPEEAYQEIVTGQIEIDRQVCYEDISHIINQSESLDDAKESIESYFSDVMKMEA